MYHGDVPRDPLDRVDSPDNSFTNLQLLDQEEDICIPDAKISASDIKQVKTSSLDPHRHCNHECVAGDGEAGEEHRDDQRGSPPANPAHPLHLSHIPPCLGLRHRCHRWRANCKERPH